MAGPNPAANRLAPPDPSVFVNEFTQPLPDPAVTFSGPGYYSPKPKVCGFATAAILTALAGVILAVPALLAILFGHIALSRTRDNHRTGRGMATGGMILGYAVSLFWSVLLTTIWIAGL